MGFIKVGDSLPVNGFVDTKDNNEIVCPKCDLPLTVIAINEDDGVELICQCERPEILEHI